MSRRCFAFLFLYLVAITAAAEGARLYTTVGLSVDTEEDASIAYLRDLVSQLGGELRVLPYELSHMRRQRLIENGDIDLAMEASLLPERASYAWFSLPYRNEQTIVVGLRHNPRISQVKHIKDVAAQQLPILAPAGGWFGPDLEQERRRWKEMGLLLVFKDPLLGFRDLHKQRAQLLVTTDVIFKQHSRHDQLIYALPFVVHKEPVYIMFSKRTVKQDEVEQFNRLIRQKRM